MKKWSKRLVLFVLIAFILVSVLPYLITVKTSDSINEKPFVESSFETVKNINIHYRFYQPITSEPKGKILLVHGLGGSTFSWRNNVQDLQDEGYLVITVDLPGFGYSDKGSGIDHSQDARSKILWNLLDTIDLSLEEETKKLDWTLVGHSMGGGTVSAMAMSRSEETDKLILVSGALFDNNPSTVPDLIYYAPIKRAIDVVYSNFVLTSGRIENFLSSAYGREPSKEEVEGYLNALQLSETPSFIPDFLKTAKSKPIEKLKNNNVPILFIAGENDTWVPKEQYAELKEMIPRVKVDVINGAAHCSMETHPEEFNKQLLNFIN
ncbi:alpha/beta fold hydrolase [Carnobacterium funditum]|uniref:alpha/beta fold hydrolase n=1 Tax=Carnobacterium funditum TaxID=2752 RepID=UPI000555DC6B|nr:alpha/beta hydrolase [Carnobacterium funditum]